jgi:hypothetical protein
MFNDTSSTVGYNFEQDGGMDMNDEYVEAWRKAVVVLYFKVMSRFTCKDQRNLRKMPEQPLFHPKLGNIFSENSLARYRYVSLLGMLL